MNTNDKSNDVVARFARGEATWAELEGFGFEDAQRIAEVGCDLIAAERWTDAETVFAGLVAMNPRDPAAQLALANVLRQLERPQEALAHYDAAVRIHPADVAALVGRGELRLHRGEREGMGDLSQAVLLDPEGKTRSGKRAQGILRALAMRAAAAAPAPSPTQG
jgi:tetratricopeptide (TPR) repeat protein